MDPTVPYNQDLEHLESQTVRDGVAQGLIEVAEKDPRLMLLCADLTESLKLETFAQRFPQQFIEVGVAEQNLLGIAAGLALSGKIPFAASYAAFNPGRNWDQLRVSIAYSQANVKILGSHAGLNVGPDGASHQALEDIAITRVLPHLMVVVPTDAEEGRKAVHALVEHDGPVYMRYGRESTPTITSASTPFILGKANQLCSGTDVTLCVNGPLVYQALRAVELVAQENISCDLFVFHTVKPLDTTTILVSALKTKAVVSAEEGQKNGGLGGAIAELLSEKLPVPLERVGVDDCFGESGKAAELAQKYALTAEDIRTALHLAIQRKV